MPNRKEHIHQRDVLNKVIAQIRLDALLKGIPVRGKP
jgi:hypothetical protein